MNILVKQNKNNNQQKWLNDLIWNTNQFIEEIALVSVFVSLVKMLLQCAWHVIDGHVWDTEHLQDIYKARSVISTGFPKFYLWRLH